MRGLALDLLRGHQGHRGGRLDDPLGASGGGDHGNGLGEADVPAHRLVHLGAGAGGDLDTRFGGRIAAEGEAQGVGAGRHPSEGEAAVAVGEGRCAGLVDHHRHAPHACPVSSRHPTLDAAGTLSQERWRRQQGEHQGSEKDPCSAHKASFFYGVA